jgi:hypothetical protein
MEFWAFLAVLGLGAWSELGYARLTQGGWRKSLPNGTITPVLKNMFVILIWPYVMRWMATHP